MKNLLQFLLHTFVLYSLGTASGHTQTQTDTYSVDVAGGQIPVIYHLPESYNAQTPVVLVLHGIKRDAQEYANTWKTLAEKYQIIVLTPLFTRELFPGANGYNLGNIFKATSEEELKGLTKPATMNPENLWSLSVPDAVFNSFRQKFPNLASTYTLYGHGAGAQFAHRFALLHASSNIQHIFVANSGWFTFPDPKVEWPYGLGGVELDITALQKKFVSLPVVIMSGLEDTKTENTVMRKTDGASLQGENRVIRAQNFYQSAQDLAKQFNLPFQWQKIVVEGAGHKDSEMAEHAVKWMIQQSR